MKKLGVCITETLVMHITHRSVELLCAENKYIEIGDYHETRQTSFT